MKSTRFLLLALALAGAPLLTAHADDAAPVADTAAAAPSAPAKMDADAIALLDQTVAAYAQTQALSQKVGWKVSIGGKARVSQGTWEFLRPGHARLERMVGKQKILLVGDAKTVFNQSPDGIEAETGNAIDETTEYLFNGPFAPLGLIFRGINPLTFPVDLGWKSATVMPDGNGIIFKLKAEPTEPEETINLRLDPATHLINLVRYDVSAPREKGGTPQKIVVSTTFKTQSVQLTPASFAFKLPAGKTAASLMKPSPYYDARLKVGATPFALSGETLDGKTLSLSDYKGKVVLLDFWATWCGPCVEELPMVKATYNKYHDQGFEVVGVSLDEDESVLRTFIQKRAMPWPQIFDKEPFKGTNATTFGVKAIPFTLLIGKDGKIIDVGARGWHLPLAVEKALQTPAS